MPIAKSGVWKGKVVEVRRGAGNQPHYQLRAVDENDDFRIAVNVTSQMSPSDLEYLIDQNFKHPLRRGFNLVEQLANARMQQMGGVRK